MLFFEPKYVIFLVSKMAKYVVKKRKICDCKKYVIYWPKCDKYVKYLQKKPKTYEISRKNAKIYEK